MTLVPLPVGAASDWRAIYHAGMFYETYSNTHTHTGRVLDLHTE